MSIRTMVVGCGAVAQRLYRRPLQQLVRRGLLRVEALVDPAVEQAAALGAFFPRAARYTNFETALSSCTPDFTLVLSPAHLHSAQTIAAIEHGSHVLCEKPMATSESECELMETAALTHKRIVSVGMIRRFFPAYSRLRDLLGEGRLGRLIDFEYREGHRFDWDVATPAAFRPRSQGGTGVLFDIGPHAVDHLEWTFGAMEVSGYFDDALAGVESNAKLKVETPTCPGLIHLSWNDSLSNELRVRAERGEVVLRIGHFDKLAVKASSGFELEDRLPSFAADLRRTPERCLSPRSYTEAMYCQIVQTLRAITLNEPPAVDAVCGRRTVSLLESSLSVARPLAMPWLTQAERNSFRRMHRTGTS